MAKPPSKLVDLGQADDAEELLQVRQPGAFSRSASRGAGLG
jgi:hypothetical protein